MSSESKKSKKAGRKLDECKNYRTNGRREINKAIRLIKTIERNPNDLGASEALKKLSESARKIAKKKILETGHQFSN